MFKIALISAALGLVVPAAASDVVLTICGERLKVVAEVKQLFKVSHIFSGKFGDRVFDLFVGAEGFWIIGGHKPNGEYCSGIQGGQGSIIMPGEHDG